MRRTFPHRAAEQGVVAAAAVLLALGACAPAQADKGGVPHEGSNGRGAQGAPPPSTPEATPGDDAAAPAPAAPEHPVKAKKHHAKQQAARQQAKRPAAQDHHQTAAAPATETKPAPPRGQHKTTICHRTGSAKNPWVVITVADPALKAHRAHGDIVPAPAGGCPKPQAAAPAPAPAPAPTEPTSPASPATSDDEAASTVAPTPTSAPTAPTGAQQPGTPTGAVLDTTASSSAPADNVAGGRVLGVRVSSPSKSGTADITAAAPAAAVRDTGRGLPFTGSPAWLVLLMGAGALLAGVALRRARFGRR